MGYPGPSEPPPPNKDRSPSQTHREHLLQQSLFILLHINWRNFLLFAQLSADSSQMENRP